MRFLKVIAAAAAAVLMCQCVSYAAEPDAVEAPLSENYVEYIQKSAEERDGIDEPFPVELVPVENNVELFETLPESFDSREKGWTSPVNNQMSTGLCWTFTTNENLETLLRKNTGADFNFSERHMENSSAQNPNDLTNPGAFGANGNGDLPRQVDDGGNSYMAAAYYTRGSGPVDEALMPFENNSIPESTAALYQETSACVYDYNFIGDLDEKSSLSDKEELIKKMKKAVMDYGSVVVGIMMRSGSDGYTGYNASNYSFYSPDNTYSTNHSVLIVGWDDNYSKENFKNTPSDDGAWIVQNSWGSTWGDSGYFYVSYDEKSVYSFTASAAAAEDGKDYDNSYVLDPLGWGYSIGYKNSTYGANIFEKTSAVELLTKVTVGNNGADSYEIFVNPSGDSLMTDDTVKAASGDFQMTGYQTVTLDTPVELTGKKFAVIVRYIKDGSTAFAVLERRSTNTMWSQADAEPGTSYISSNAVQWTEVSNSSYNFSNCSIKAFTEDITPKTRITFKKSNPMSMIYITNEDGYKFTPRANGDFSVPDGEYLYTASLYGRSDVTGTFEARGGNKMLYIYEDPVGISEAASGFDALLNDCGQSWSISTLTERFEEKFGSTFRVDTNNLELIAPSEENNGRINGELTIYDTFRGEETNIPYDGKTLYKARIADTGGNVEITAMSDTGADTVIAKYDESGGLIGIEKTAVSMAEGETEVISYDNGGASRVCVFLWDMGRLYPCAAGLK